MSETTEAAPRARVGVREVAAAAGVSTQTVSRVINDHPHIRPETRERVEVAMAELGYRVNNAARALGTATTRTIGVLASDSDLFGPAAGIAALEAAARATGRWISTAYADGADTDAVVAAAEHLLVQGVDGIVVVAPHAGTREQLAAAKLGVPLVSLHGDASGQSAAIALAVDHLVERGHRRIAQLSGPGAWVEAAARAGGVVAALARHGLEPAGVWEGDWSARSGAALAAPIADVLRTPDAPTAIVAGNDQMALGLIAGLDALGIRVPEDVSVTGFDDNPDAAYYRPALTTVRLDVAGEARRCIEALTAGVSDPEAAEARLIVRASTAQA